MILNERNCRLYMLFVYDKEFLTLYNYLRANINAKIFAMSFTNWKPFCSLYTLFENWNHNPKPLIVGLRPVIQILCHVLARGCGRWPRYSTEAKAEVKYRASTRIRGPKHDTRFEWPVSILIMTRYLFLPFKTHKTSAKNPYLLTIAGAIWFCRYRQCTPS